MYVEIGVMAADVRIKNPHQFIEIHVYRYLYISRIYTVFPMLSLLLPVCSRIIRHRCDPYNQGHDILCQYAIYILVFTIVRAFKNKCQNGTKQN